MIVEITNSQLCNILQTWLLKKDMPADYRPWSMRANFGLYGYRYVVAKAGEWLLKDGQWLPFHKANLLDIGTVVGPKDLGAANHKAWAEAWRSSVRNAIAERCKMSGLILPVEP